MDIATALHTLGLSVPRFTGSMDSQQQQAKAWKRDVLKPAYRAKAKQTHPDVGGLAEQFTLVRAAFEALRDAHVVPRNQAGRQAQHTVYSTDSATTTNVTHQADGWTVVTWTW